MDGKAQLVLSLHSIGAIKFGAYKLKSGIISPFYLDLRILVSYPRVLRETAQVMAELLATLKFDRLAAIPYAALPIGAAERAREGSQCHFTGSLGRLGKGVICIGQR